MNAHETCEALGITLHNPKNTKQFDNWALSQSTFEHAQGLLDQAAIQETAQSLHFPDDLCAALQQAVQKISANEALLRMMWHSCCQMRTDDDHQFFAPIDEAHPRIHPLANALVYLFLVPELREQYAQKGIPTDICEDTLGDLLIWLRDLYDKTSVWAFERSGWLQYHFRMKLFKIGRLQFELNTLDDGVSIFRQQKGRRLKVFVHGDRAVRDDGLFMSCKGAGSEIKIADFERGTDSVAGAACDPHDGTVIPEREEIKLSEWREAITTGDDILAVHIPACGPMDMKLCAQSFAAALPFFKKYYPEHAPRAFHCASWLLSPYFSKGLKEQSNILRFQKPWCIYPQSESDDHEFIERVWGVKQIDVKTAAQVNSLQRTIIAHINEGGVWNDMSGVLFPEDVSF